MPSVSPECRPATDLVSSVSRRFIDAVLALNGHQHERLVAQPSCGVDGPASVWRYVLVGRSNLCGCNGPLRERTSALIQGHLSWVATSLQATLAVMPSSEGQKTAQREIVTA